MHYLHLGAVESTREDMDIICLDAQEQLGKGDLLVAAEYCNSVSDLLHHIQLSSAEITDLEHLTTGQ